MFVYARQLRIFVYKSQRVAAVDEPYLPTLSIICNEIWQLHNMAEVLTSYMDLF
jgi:hypothetical protein